MRYEPWIKVDEPWIKLALVALGLLGVAAVIIGLCGCGEWLPDFVWPEDGDPTPYTSPAGYVFGFGIYADETSLDPAVAGAELDARIAEWQALRPGYEYEPARHKYVVVDKTPAEMGASGAVEWHGGIWACFRTAPPLAAIGHELDHVVYGPEYGH